MASNLLTSQAPQPTPATPALDAARASQALAVPVSKATKGLSFADELQKPSAARSSGPMPTATPSAAAKTPQASDSQNAGPAKMTDQTMRKVLPSLKQDVDKAPAVALLTGRLEKVPAGDIPALVTGNKFIKDALSSGEIQGYLNAPAAAADLVKDLGLPPQVLQQVQALGIDVAQKMTPNDLLKALGIDAQQVMAELTQLKANLPLEGLSPYINRAQILNPKGASPVVPPVLQPILVQPTLVQPTLVQPVNPGQTQAEPALMAADDIEPIGFAWVPNPPREVLPKSGKNPPIALTATPQVPVLTMPNESNQPEDLSPQALLAALQEMPRMQRPAFDLLKPTPAASGDERVVVAAALVATNDGVDDALDAMVARANPDGTLEILTVQDSPLLRPAEGLGNKPKLNNATFDAFAQLGARMRVADTVVLEDASLPQRILASDSFLNEQMLSRSFENARNGEPFSPLLQKSAGDQAPMMVQVKTTEIATVMPATAKNSARLPALDQKVMMQELLQGAPTAFAVTKSESLSIGPLQNGLQAQQDLRLQAPLLSLNLPPDRSGGDSAGSEQPSHDPSQSSEHGQGPRELSLGQHQNLVHQANTTKFSTQVTAASEPLNAQTRLDLMQRVVNHATMMAKQGGGTVRLDLSSPEFGPLELALNMSKDKIDVRVLAGSDRARDAIVADLNQLKGALAVQNVQLGKVEVGIGGRQPQPQSQGFASMNQQNGQHMGGRQADDWRRNQVDVPQVSRINPVARARVPAVMLQSQMADLGRIAVRA